MPDVQRSGDDKPVPQNPILEEFGCTAAFRNCHRQLDDGIGEFFVLCPLLPNKHIQAYHDGAECEDERCPPQRRFYPRAADFGVVKRRIAFIKAADNLLICNDEMLRDITVEHVSPIVFQCREPEGVRQCRDSERQRIMPSQTGGDGEHRVDGNHLALRQCRFRRDPLDKQVYQDKEKDVEDDVPEEGDSRGMPGMPDTLNFDDPKYIGGYEE